MTSINIAIIDGKGPPQSLIKTLADAGYICHRARGPLKLREVLATFPIRLILWRVAALSPELAEDLFRECSQNPAIPIIHLYTDKAHTAHLPAGLVPRDSIPDKVRGKSMLEVLSSVLGEAVSEPMAGTELAFRNLVTRLAASPSNSRRENAATANRGDFHTISTALNQSERALLNDREPAPTAYPPFSQCANIISWIRREIFPRIASRRQ